MRGLLLLAALLPCTACSTIVDGTHQKITVSTNPPGASCTLLRQGASIGSVPNTPGSTDIRKSKYDITIECEKPGFTKATYLNHSGVADATFGNIAAGGGVGWLVDSAVGADNKYDGVVNMTLVPATAAATPAPAAKPATPAS